MLLAPNWAHFKRSLHTSSSFISSKDRRAHRDLTSNLRIGRCCLCMPARRPLWCAPSLRVGLPHWASLLASIPEVHQGPQATGGIHSHNAPRTSGNPLPQRTSGNWSQLGLLSVAQDEDLAWTLAQATVGQGFEHLCSYWLKQHLSQFVEHILNS